MASLDIETPVFVWGTSILHHALNIFTVVGYQRHNLAYSDAIYLGKFMDFVAQEQHSSRNLIYFVAKDITLHIQVPYMFVQFDLFVLRKPGNYVLFGISN